MEIKMTECPNGHYYNAAIHDSCPMCAEGAAPRAQGSFPTTAPPQGAQGQGSFPSTAPPPGASPSAASMSRTMPVNNRDAAPDDRSARFSVPTQVGGNLAADGQTDPVVGWLVCIDGPVRGVDFRIHSGYNYIGREEGDIHIHGDNQISHRRHAVISYYAKKHTFYVGPAEGRNIIELNDEPVFNAVEINSHDVLTIGSTKLMFVPLCGPKFGWTEGVRNG